MPVDNPKPPFAECTKTTQPTPLEDVKQMEACSMWRLLHCKFNYINLIFSNAFQHEPGGTDRNILFT